MNKKYIILIIIVSFLSSFSVSYIKDYFNNSYNKDNITLMDQSKVKYTTFDREQLSYIDLRQAAKITVPAVVNVTPVKMEKYYIGNPLDFWFGGRKAGKLIEQPKDMGIGSGVIISQDGYIITNNHVIESSDKIVVTLNNKKKYEAQLIGADINTDIALLKIDEENLPYVKYGDSDEVVLGEWVLAVGNPYNLTSTVTAGIISAKARSLGEQINLESFLQTDAAVNPGNSGGALVNAAGELIGINTIIQSPTGSYAGYSFAVPINIAAKIVSDLQKYGEVKKAVLGISMVELTPQIASELKIPEKNGIYVADVLPHSAAYKAGIKVGDVIQQINKFDVGTVPKLQGQLAKYGPQDKIQVSLSRNGKLQELEVILQGL